jgi:hypothetical protein
VIGLGIDALNIGAGASHTCAVTYRHRLVDCWGDNEAGQLGDGTTTNSSTPVQVSGITSGQSVLFVSAGGLFTCAWSPTAVDCWGSNSDGQLGDGTNTDSSIPVAVQGLPSNLGTTLTFSGGKSPLVTGRAHACLLLPSGDVECWGANGDGQLGDGNTTPSSTPVSVVGLSGPADGLAAGGNSTCALLTSGAVECWGANDSGQLGDGTTNGSPTPVVAGISGATAVTMGTNHTCALKTHGAALCWGSNSDGEIGDGTTTERDLPTAVAGLSSGVSSIAAGAVQTCAIIGVSKAECWGAGGVVGDGTDAQQDQPALVSAGEPLRPPPTIDGTIPSYPDSTHPYLVGTALAGSQVNVYKASGCNAGSYSSIPATTFTTTGIDFFVSANSTTTFSATISGWGQTSGCSPDFTYSEKPPDTQITSGPGDPSFVSSASFAFSSHDSIATFQCSLDGGNWGACTSPKNYSNLSLGSHTFTVKAGDNLATDPTGASQTWTVSLPDTQIISGPDDPTYATSASFDFLSNDDAATLQCSLDGSTWTTCTSPASYSGLSLGVHSFEARAVSGLGPDPTPPSETWTINPPDTRITDGPASGTRYRNASFSFASDDALATFECSLDGSDWASCSSPQSYSGLAGGAHSFRVHALNELGDVDPTGASQTWTIDLTTPPTAALAPTAGVVGDSVTLDASASTDPPGGSIVDFKWDLGNGHFDHDTGGTPSITTTFANPGEVPVRVEVTDDLGLSDIASTTVPILRQGGVGVSINNGDYATNTANVQLDLVWPEGATKAEASNDGGFGPAGNTETVGVAPAIAWRLAAAGHKRFPKTVYLRFPDSSTPNVTYTDDIILDTTIPVVESATSAGVARAEARGSKSRGAGRDYKVRLRAKENLSGISELQFSTSHRGGTTLVLTDHTKRGILRLARTVTIPMTARPKWLRARSAAGNWSKWHRIAQPGKPHKKH